MNSFGFGQEDVDSWRILLPPRQIEELLVLDLANILIPKVAAEEGSKTPGAAAGGDQEEVLLR